MKRKWLLMNHVGVYENINVVRRSEIYIFDRVDVCLECFKVVLKQCFKKSYDIENDTFSILLVSDKKNNDKNKTYSNCICMMVTTILYVVCEPYILCMISIKSSRLCANNMTTVGQLMKPLKLHTLEDIFIPRVSEVIMFITRVSDVIMFSPCVFVCLSRCLSGRFNYEELVPHKQYFAGTLLGMSSWASYVSRTHDVINYVTRSQSRSNFEIDISPSIFELERRSKAQNVGNAHGYLSGIFNSRYDFR